MHSTDTRQISTQQNARHRFFLVLQFRVPLAQIAIMHNLPPFAGNYGKRFELLVVVSHVPFPFFPFTICTSNQSLSFFDAASSRRNDESG
jgi:hypothetical protein